MATTFEDLLSEAQPEPKQSKPELHGYSLKGDDILPSPGLADQMQELLKDAPEIPLPVAIDGTTKAVMQLADFADRLDKNGRDGVIVTENALAVARAASIATENSGLVSPQLRGEANVLIEAISKGAPETFKVPSEKNIREAATYMLTVADADKSGMLSQEEIQHGLTSAATGVKFGLEALERQ